MTGPALKPASKVRLRTFWNGKWYTVPSVHTLERWDVDGYCRTPDNKKVESDHPDSWLSILGLI